MSHLLFHSRFEPDVDVDVVVFSVGVGFFFCFMLLNLFHLAVIVVDTSGSPV